MIENINKMLEKNDVMVRCYTEWYKLESIGITDEGKMPIIVSNEDGEELSHFDFADVDGFDSEITEALPLELDWANVGIA